MRLKTTERRTCVDFAERMRDLVGVHCPAAQRTRVVLDNLATQSARALYHASPPADVRRILRRLELRDVAKRASC